MTIRRVVKVGGSCLMHADLTSLLTGWLERQPLAQNLLIVGGGQAIEAMRDLAALHRLDEPAMHWRCVRMLRASAEVVAELVPVLQLLSSSEGTETLLGNPPQVGHWLLAVDSFYHPSCSAKSGLPEGWATTTDAIAAYLARKAGADELVLLKSCNVPADASPESLAAAGVVDPAFPAALAANLCWRIERLGN